MVQPIRKTFTEMLAVLLDRAVDARATCNDLYERWRLDVRRKIEDDGGMENPPQIVDMLRVLATVLEFRPIVNIPEYRNRRASTVTEGEWITSNVGRHGRMLAIKSNQSTFSFSVTIEDVNVVTADGKIGAPRTFMVQDMTGNWHEGWSELKVRPGGLDPDVLAMIGSPTIACKHFIHPSRWPSFYGAPHLLAMVAAEVRLKDELSYWTKWAKGVKAKLGIQPKPYPKRTKVGAAEKIDVQAFEVKVDGAELTGEYPARFDETAEGLDKCSEYMSRLRWLQSSLRLYCRATHFAFYRYALTTKIPADAVLDWLTGGREDLQPALPAWVAGKTWETGYLEKPKAKIRWARMELRNGLALRFRCWTKSEEVKAEIEEAAPTDEDSDE